ncbi:MAG: ABC transporter ATP-binding protein [Bacillota bacterium]|nr:MAG: ABC transporter ATP-binding protein [Bacillota bacterium]
MKKPLIELVDIDMYFTRSKSLLHKERRVHVLKKLNLKIYEGEILAVVGESGCGKTTVGRIITGLLKPTRGNLLYEGESAINILNMKSKAYKDAVQFIQQDSYAALNPVRTIFQSLYAPIKTKNQRMTHDEIYAEVYQNLVKVGLTPPEEILMKYPHQLSGGQRQRVLMARAISLKPKLIVADEPVSMIDVSLRLSILNLMMDLNKQMNISFVYITHDLATARYIANKGRIAVMYLGEIVELAPVEELLARPRHPYTQALLAAVPIPDPVLAKKDRVVPIKQAEHMDLTNRADGCSFYPRCPYGKEECTKGEIPYKSVENTKYKCVREIKK